MAAHEQAVIVNADPAMGKHAGDPVTIDEIERFYSDTKAAGKVNRYTCANKNCLTPVKAVIIQKNKPGRQKSPSSHFRGHHIEGCDREAKPIADGEQAKNSLKPKEEKSQYCTRWVQPHNNSSTQGEFAEEIPHEPKGSPQKGSRKIRGSKSNNGQSELIWRFAKDWRSMSTHTRYKTPLTAPWNSGGTYYSAFIPLIYYKNKDIEDLGERIFTGTLKNVIHGRTGFTLILQEPHHTGLPFWVWVTNQTFNGVQGKVLYDQFEVMAEQNRVEPLQVFALGKFEAQSRGENSWWSLKVNHARDIALLVNKDEEID